MSTLTLVLLAGGVGFVAGLLAAIAGFLYLLYRLL